MIDDRKLIAEIKSHPLLYDPGVPENRDVNAKESTWNFIAKSLGYTVRECKMRWKSLRERFARERKKIIMTNHGESMGSDDDHEKDGQKPGSWHLMKEMNFLWNFVFHRNMNRSKSLLYLNPGQEDHSNMQIATSSLSAPIWLLPSIHHNNMPPAIPPQPVSQEDTSSDCGETSTGRVKDPLSNDEDNSLTFDIGSSDSDDSHSKKRHHEEQQPRLRAENTVLKRVRRNSNGYPTSTAITSTPVTTTVLTSHQNDASISSGMHVGTNMVIVSEIEKKQVHHSAPSDVNRVTVAATEGKERDDNMTDNQLKSGLYRSLSTNSKCACHCGRTKQSEDELFCSSIAASMQRLTAKQRALLKLQIQKALYEIEYPE